ncbi:hypothetical protein FA13DRAFT_1709571 [Coprinellus micaceus]|uniref:Uncharacterized protein n=1 Tax=Coprinellus micaceus TaxID=71717 RepID=A0A4Y7TCA9_COPMI|nr:hypothetical protein FA13DRAFT_1709571 [Coprinellus micaceus]
MYSARSSLFTPSPYDVSQANSSKSPHPPSPSDRQFQVTPAREPGHSPQQRSDHGQVTRIHNRNSEAGSKTRTSNTPSYARCEIGGARSCLALAAVTATAETAVNVKPLGSYHQKGVRQTDNVTPDGQISDPAHIQGSPQLPASQKEAREKLEAAHNSHGWHPYAGHPPSARMNRTEESVCPASPSQNDNEKLRTEELHAASAVGTSELCAGALHSDGGQTTDEVKIE